jgi:PsbP-like protein
VLSSILLFITTNSSQAFAEVYQNTSYHYSIWYPSNWFVDGNGWSSVISLEPKTDSCKCTLLIVGASQPHNNATLEHSKDTWTSQAVIFEPVKNVTHMTFLGLPAYKIFYASNNSPRPPPLPEHEMIKILTVKSGVEYSLDFDAREPQLPVVQKMIDSFRITSSPIG